MRQHNWTRLAQIIGAWTIQLLCLKSVLVASAVENRMCFKEWEWSDECQSSVCELMSSFLGMYLFYVWFFYLLILFNGIEQVLMLGFCSEPLGPLSHIRVVQTG